MLINPEPMIFRTEFSWFGGKLRKKERNPQVKKITAQYSDVVMRWTAE
jgi:hypothetical protein